MTTVNAARKDLFTRKGRDIESIPPTADALLQHAKRATFQAGHCWGKCLEVSPQLPPPSKWGWERGPTQTWEPLWTTIPQASQSCQELLKCGCKSEKGCTGWCKCVRAELPCTHVTVHKALECVVCIACHLYYICVGSTYVNKAVM